MAQAMLHLSITLTEIKRDLAREWTLLRLEQAKATGKHPGRRKGSTGSGASGNYYGS